MRLVALWVVALLLGALAGGGVSALGPKAGAGSLALVGISWLVFAVVTSSVITAGESLVPALRSANRRPVRRR